MTDEVETLRSQVEEQGKALEELRQLLDTTPDALVVVDRAGAIVLINQQAERLFGYSREELLGSELERLLPERFRSTHHRHRQHFAANSHVRPMGAGLDLFGLTRDGREFPVEISLSPIHLGDQVLFASAIRDVTAHVELEASLRRARDTADRATAAKARFIAAASHDLRQPLQAASIYLDLATSESVTPEQRDDAVAKTQRCVETLTSLLNKIMHVSKLDSEAVTPHRSDFAVMTLFDRVRDHYSPAAADKGLEIRVARSSAVLRSDPVLLQQLLENLVSNAVRYTPRGRILLGCRRRGDQALLQVWDTGVGIAAEELDRIFEEFHRLGGSGVDANLGMGLGLAIVRRLELLLDHPVSVRSRVGRGTVFEVRVPCGQVPLEERDEGLGAAEQGERQGLVVVVDDDVEVLAAIETVLEVSGHAVVAGESLAAVERRLKSAAVAPDLVLTDYRLGARGTGLEVIEALRGRFGTRIPAIVLTGDSSYSLLEKEADETGFALLAKPVDTSQLLAAVARGLASTEKASS